MSDGPLTPQLRGFLLSLGWLHPHKMALNKDNMAEEIKTDAGEVSTQEKEGSTDITELAKALKESLDREAAEKARADKAETERENYKKGMLKAKGKLETDETEEIEGGTSEKKDTTSSELIGLVKTLLEKNNELAVASANRSQIATSSQGGSSEAKVEVSDNLLSADQISNLKARGWDDKKIARFKENVKNVRA